MYNVKQLKNTIIMNNNILEIIAPEGYVVEQVSEGKVTFKKIQNVGKVELPKKWEDLGNITGWYASSDEVLEFDDDCKIGGASADVFVTKEQAQAVIALAKLSQLREVYRGGWKPNWFDGRFKYCIVGMEDRTVGDYFVSEKHFLSFQSAEVRDEFLRNFRDLIEEASPLLFG